MFAKLILTPRLGSMFSQAMKKWVQGNSDEVRHQDDGGKLLNNLICPFQT